jgi:branched-chain amino acid transport system ATP-binding protein
LSRKGGADGSVLSASQLCVSYGETRALWEVNFELKRSEVVALIGPNGAGKTTTLNAVQGLVMPDSGKVRFGSKDITGMKANEVTACGVSLVPEGRGLFSAMTVKENLHLGAFTRRARGNLDSNLEKVYAMFPVLRERSGQAAGSLSGGEQQMLAIARGLMSEPEVLMLDEPSLGLAPMMVSNVFKTLAGLRETTDITIFLVEQNVEAALGIADRAYLLEEGRVTLEGDADGMRGNPKIREAYLGL